MTAFLVWLVVFFQELLPEKVPIHFTMDGTPNSWAGKGSLFTMLFVAVGVSALFYLIILSLPWVKSKPGLLNIPYKRQVLALPEEKQRPFWDLTVEFLAAVVSAMDILWLTAVYGTIRVALGHEEKLPSWAVWPGLILVFTVTIIYFIRMIVISKKLIKDLQRS